MRFSVFFFDIEVGDIFFLRFLNFCIVIFVTYIIVLEIGNGHVFFAGLGDIRRIVLYTRKKGIRFKKGSAADNIFIFQNGSMKCIQENRLRIVS